jgi:hypothetical protein
MNEHLGNIEHILQRITRLVESQVPFFDTLPDAVRMKILMERLESHTGVNASLGIAPARNHS